MAAEFDREKFARSVLLWLFTPNMVINQPDVVATIEQLILAEPPRPEAFMNQIAAVHDHDTREQLHQIEAPTLVMVARRDFMVPPELGRVVHESIPGSRLEDARRRARLQRGERRGVQPRDPGVPPSELTAMAAKTPKKASGPPEGLAFDEPHKKQGLTFAVLPTDRSQSSRTSGSRATRT